MEYMELLEQINNLYNSFFTNLIVLIAIIFGLFGLGIPFFIQMIQKRFYRIEEEKLKNNLKEYVETQVEIEKEKIKEILEDALRETLKESKKQRGNLHAKLYHVMGNFYSSQNRFADAWFSYSVALKAYLLTEDVPNVLMILRLLEEVYYSKLDRKILERLEDEGYPLTELIDLLIAENKNGQYTFNIKKMKQELRKFIKQPS